MLIIIEEVIDPRQKIAAIKELRAMTGMPLGEAKRSVDKIIGGALYNSVTGRTERHDPEAIEVEVEFYPELFRYKDHPRAIQMRAHAANWFDSTKGNPGSGFVVGLFNFTQVCDASNLMKLRSAFPIEIDAWIEARNG